MNALEAEVLTLVGTRVLEEDDLALLEMQPGLLSDEQVGTLDDVLEVWLALRVDKSSNIRDIDSLGPE